MEISTVIKALEVLVDSGNVYRPSRNMIRIEIPEFEYDAAVTAVANLKLADLVNNKRAVMAFPKLVTAVQLVLSIERTDVGAGSLVRLSTKVKAQLIKALEIAEEEIPG